MKASIIMAVWVTTSSRRRDTRSATTPPYNMNNQAGRPLAKAT
jgi:hypothetical protein